MRSHTEAPSTFSSLLGIALCLFGVAVLLGASSAPAADPNGDGIQGPPSLSDWNYEKVSPADKGGADISSNMGTVATPSGSHVLYTSYGVFAGSPAGAFPSYYIGERQPHAWLTQGISPPQLATGTASPNRVRAITDDFSRSIVFTPTDLTGDLPSGSWGMYRHDIATGDYDFIAPSIGGGEPGVAGIDASGDTVLLTSNSALTSDAPASFHKVYIWREGELELASRLPGGAPTNGSAGGTNYVYDYALSRDGGVYYFEAASTPKALYRVDGDGPLAINQEEHTTESPVLGNASFQGATPDGSKALFISSDALLDEDVDGPCASGNTTCDDLYLYDHSRPEGDRLTLVSNDQEPADTAGDRARGVLGMSEDGSHVYFAASGQLEAGEPTAPPVKLYAWIEGEGIRYIGGFPSGLSNEIWNASQGARLVRRERYVSVNGRALLFSAPGDHSPFSTFNHGGIKQVYLYDSLLDSTVCVACPSSPQAPADIPAELFTAIPSISSWKPAPRSTSADGRRAFFQTYSRLVPEDTNGALDVYMWQDGQPYLISTGKGPNARYVSTDADGDDVFFTTAQQLSGWDQDGLADLYVARAAGGLPEPPAPPTACIGQECQGPLGSRPAPSAPGSASFAGLGNLRQAGGKRCAKGKRKVTRKGKARCVTRKRASRNRCAKLKRKANRKAKARCLKRQRANRNTKRNRRAGR